MYSVITKGLKLKIVAGHSVVIKLLTKNANTFTVIEKGNYNGRILPYSHLIERCKQTRNRCCLCYHFKREFMYTAPNVPTIIDCIA